MITEMIIEESDEIKIIVSSSEEVLSTIEQYAVDGGRCFIESEQEKEEVTIFFSRHACPPCYDTLYGEFPTLKDLWIKDEKAYLCGFAMGHGILEPHGESLDRIQQKLDLAKKIATHFNGEGVFWQNPKPSITNAFILVIFNLI